MAEKISKRKRTGRRAPSTQHISPKGADAFTQASGTPTRPQFSFLTPDGFEQIKKRAFDLLAEHGVAVVHPQANAKMREAGATPGKEADRLKFPRELVAEALENTPREVTLCGKKPERVICTFHVKTVRSLCARARVRMASLNPTQPSTAT